MIRVKNLGKYFGDLKAVDGITFEVENGEIFGFLGPNGAGKTTTIRLLSCIISPSVGNAWLNGYNIRDNQMEIRQNVGILTENPCLYERLNAEYNLDFFGKLYDVPADIRAKRIEEILTLFDLQDRRYEKIETYSKGMKQKLALGRTLLHDPKVLFLDEPTSALDPKTAKGVRDYIKQLRAEGDRIVFICTHNLTEAEYLCDRVAVIDQGHIVGIGRPEDLSRELWKGDRVEISLKNYDTHIEIALKDLTNTVVNLFEYEGNVLKLNVQDAMTANPIIIETLVRAGAQIVSVEIKRLSLEEVYLNIVKD